MACAKVGRPKLHILLLGAFSSGKTTILREIMNDHNYRKRPVIPTLGMYKKNFSFHNYKLQILDIGGSKEVQKEWPYLFGEAQGFMFTIDSTDMKNVTANTNSLRKTLEHPEVEGKPFIIIVTKCTSPYHMQENLLFAAYDMDTILSIHKNVQICFCDSQHHALYAKSNIQLDYDSRHNFCFNKGTDMEGVNLEGADTEPPEDVAGASPVKLGGDEQPFSDDDTVYLAILDFKEGIQWLLEFIESNKPDIDSRVTIFRKMEEGITKAQKKRSKKQLVQLQKDWQKHYKNVSKSGLAIAVSKSNTFIGSQYDLLQIPHIAPGQSLQSQVVIQSGNRLTKIHEVNTKSKSVVRTTSST